MRATDAAPGHVPPAPEAASEGFPFGRVALGAVALAAAVRVTIFLSVSLGRLSFPWEVEFLEGLTIDYSVTLLRGGNLYAPPSAHFAPHWYPPLHYVVSLGAFLVGGFSLAVARALSIASVLLALGLGARLLRKAGASWAAVLLFVAAAMSFYPSTVYWYDVARVDSLATLLALSGVIALASSAGRPSHSAVWTAGALFVLAVFAKQTNVAVVAGALLFLVLERDWARLFRLSLALLAFGAPAILLMALAYGGDAAIIVTHPANHHFDPSAVRGFVSFAWPMLPLFAAVVLAARRAGGERARTLRLLMCVSGLAFLAGLVTMCKMGGQSNSSMPAIFLLALASGAATDTLLHGRRLRFAVPGLALLLLALPPWDYLDWVPTRSDRQEAAEILEDMRAVDGPFLAYNASFVSTVMRGEMYPYWDRLYDWAGGFSKGTRLRPDATLYPPDFVRLIRDRHFEAIYTNGGDYFDDPVHKVIAQHYRPVRYWNAGMPAGGQATRWRHCVPRLKWVPRHP